MRVYRESRRQLFERLERATLLQLAATRYTYASWKLNAKVNLDYHVELDGHYYSAPHTLLRERVDIRATATTVELYRGRERVASHPRSSVRGKHSTITEHMPKAHQQHSAWSPTRIIQWGKTIGPNTASLCEAILNERRHPEQGYRSCLGILRLSKRYGHERLEIACKRALDVGARSYRHVESILSHGLDRVEPNESTKQKEPRMHENVRGPGYYH